MKATVSGVLEDLKFKVSERSDQNWCFPDSVQLAVSAKLRQLTGCLSLAETANWAQSGKHQFWSEPSEILNLRSSTTPETVAFTPP